MLSKARSSLLVYVNIEKGKDIDKLSSFCDNFLYFPFFLWNSIHILCNQCSIFIVFVPIKGKFIFFFHVVNVINAFPASYRMQAVSGLDLSVHSKMCFYIGRLSHQRLLGFSKPGNSQDFFSFHESITKKKKVVPTN